MEYANKLELECSTSDSINKCHIHSHKSSISYLIYILVAFNFTFKNVNIVHF